MRSLPLYDGDTRTILEKTEPLSYNGGCDRCDLSKQADTVCIRPHATPSTNSDKTLLVVADKPLLDDDRAATSFISNSGAWAQSQIAKLWGGRVIYTYAVRCRPSKKVTDTNINACRGYLSAIIRQTTPDKIITLGQHAYQSVTGRSVHPSFIRKGYSFTHYGQPIYALSDATSALKNRFKKQHFLEDLKWAFLANPKPPPLDGVYFLIENADDAEKACRRLVKHGSVTYDTEYSGGLHTKYFRIDTLAAALTGTDEVYVWDEQALEDEDCRKPLIALLENPNVGKVGHNIKVDLKAVACDPRLNAQVKGAKACTLLWRKLDDTDVMGRLEYQSELVGMGGHKSKMERAVADAVKIITKTREEISKKDLLLPDMMPRPMQASVDYPDLGPHEFAYGLVASPLRSQYCALDVVSTSRLAPRLQSRIRRAPGLQRAWDSIYSELSMTMAQIEKWGFLVDKGQIENVGRFVDGEIEKLRPKMFSFGEYNPNSPDSLANFLYEKLKLPVLKWTDGGKPATDGKTLLKLKGKHPAVDVLLSFKELDTIRERYGWNLMDYVRGDGRVHSSFNITGTKTGRFSCVAAWTKIKTKRGLIAIKDIRIGDFVWTHRGRWRAVTRQWVKGVDAMFDIRFSNGQVLTCTRDHRLLTSSGEWITVGCLVDECIEKVGKICPQYRRSSGSLPKNREHYTTNCFATRDDTTQCLMGSSESYAKCRTKSFGQTSLFNIEDRKSESHERTHRTGESLLERPMRGWSGLSDLFVSWETGVCASCRNDEFFKRYATSCSNGGSPHRRGPEEQCDRQSGFSDCNRPSFDTLFAGQGQSVLAIEAIYPRGDYEVYDITVDEDASYSACGVYHHNSSEPNTQNIPSRSPLLAKMVKNIFIVPPDHTLVQLDYSQLEYRVAAVLSGDKLMQQVFIDGHDLHRRTAELISKDAWNIERSVMEGYDKDQIKPYRSASKTVNFGTLYGKGVKSLAADLEISVNKAAQLVQSIMGQFVDLNRWTQEQIRWCQKHGYVHTYMDGEPALWRPLWGIASPDGAQMSTCRNASINTPVQGSAALYMSRSLNAMVAWILRNNIPAKVVGTVHDSMLLEIHNSCVDEVVWKCKTVMESWWSSSVPLVVDGEKGQKWGKLAEFLWADK